MRLFSGWRIRDFRLQSLEIALKKFLRIYRYKVCAIANLDRRTLQVGFFIEVRTVRNQASHADAERKEGLPHGAEHDGRVDFPEIGFEKKLQPFASAW